MATPTFKTTFHPLTGEPEFLVALGQTLIQIAGWVGGDERDFTLEGV